MNILVDKLPEAIKIRDKIYPINADFRNCIKIILAFEDPELVTVEKQAILILNLYQEFPLEEHLEEAFIKGIQFLDGGKPRESSEESKKSPRVYSFQKDAEIIFAAFQQTHGLDLQAAEFLHWWKFLSLFMDLGSETVFCNLISLRKRVKTGKASKEEISLSKEMGDIFDIPEIDDRTLEEKEKDREFVAMVKEARKRKKEQAK